MKPDVPIEVQARGRSGAGWTWRAPQTWLTLAILAGFAVLTVYLTRRTATGEPEWSRLLYLFGSVEALVFAAIGAALGTHISRSQVEAADHRAEKYEADADTAKSLAQKNEGLAQEALTLESVIKAKGRVLGALAIPDGDEEDQQEDGEDGGPSFDHILGLGDVNVQSGDARREISELLLVIQEFENRRGRSI